MAGLTFVVFFGGALPYIHIPQARIVVQLLMVVAAAVGIALVSGRKLDLWTPLAIPAFMCIAVVGLSALWSTEPSVSREAFALLLLGATTYPLIRYLVWDPALSPRVDTLLTIAAVGIVGIYLGRVALYWFDWIRIVGPAVPPMRPADFALSTGTVNSVATYLELLVPSAIWVLHRRYGLRASASLAVAAITALVVTSSRGAWVGVAAAASLLAVVNWRSILGARRDWIVASRTRLVAIVAVLITGVLVIALALLPRLVAGDAGRFEMWSAAAQMGFGHPLLGTGPATWGDTRPSFPIVDSRTTALFTPHNSVLHVFAETGLAGIVSVLILLIAIALLAVREIRSVAASPANLGQRGFAQAAAASLLAVGVHSLVDPLFGVPAVAAMAMFLVARLDRPGTSPRTATGPAPALAIAAAALVAVAMLVPADTAMVRAAAGNGELSRSEWQAAAADFDAAVAIDDRPVYRLGQALAAAGQGDVEKARVALAAARTTNDLSLFAAAGAHLAREAGDDDEAARLARDVVAAGAYDPTSTVNAAAILFDLGDRGTAVDGLADAMVAIPSLIYSERPAPLFDDDAWRAARDRALDAVATADPAGAAYATIRMRPAEPDVDAALARVPAGPERDMLIEVAAAERTGEVDLPAVRAIVRRAPESRTVLLAWDRLARLAESQSDLEEARTLSIIAFNDINPLDLDLELDSEPFVNYSHRVIGFPTALSRQGPLRPYPVGMVTIEPVLRKGEPPAPPR